MSASTGHGFHGHQGLSSWDLVPLPSWPREGSSCNKLYFQYQVRKVSRLAWDSLPWAGPRALTRCPTNTYHSGNLTKATWLRRGGPSFKIRSNSKIPALNQNYPILSLLQAAPTPFLSSKLLSRTGVILGVTSLLPGSPLLL